MLLHQSCDKITASYITKTIGIAIDIPAQVNDNAFVILQ